MLTQKQLKNLDVNNNDEPMFASTILEKVKEGRLKSSQRSVTVS